MTTKEEIQALEKELAHGKITTPAELQAFKNKFISKKGTLATLFTTLRTLPLEARKQRGRALNELREKSKAKYEALQKKITATGPGTCTTPPEDLTLPPAPVRAGGLHPLEHITQKVVRIFQRIGFSLADGPEIEGDWNNFTALNFLPDHPARQMQDTFFIEKPTKEKSLLRTHTSSVQVHTLQNTPPPIRVLSTGKVFRKETISARTHCIFHQLEALYINKEVNFLSLKATVFFLCNISLVQKLKSAFALPTFPLQSPVPR